MARVWRLGSPNEVRPRGRYVVLASATPSAGRRSPRDAERHAGSVERGAVYALNRPQNART
jgi:hypothetical protein